MGDKTLYNRDLIITVLGYLIIFFFVRENYVFHICALHIVLALVFPAVLRWSHLFWHYLTLVMSKITSPILFGGIFFIVLTPISFLYRIFRKKKVSEASSFVAVSESGVREFFGVPW